MIDWHNFFLGILLWLGGSGFLLTLMGDNSSADSSKDLSNERILQLEKLLSEKQGELNKAYTKINTLEAELEQNNQQQSQAEIEFESQQNNLQSRIVTLENQLATKTSELNNAYAEIELWHQRVEKITTDTYNQQEDNQAQIEVLEKQLKEQLNILEDTRNNIRELEEELSQTYDELEQSQDELTQYQSEMRKKIEDLTGKCEELNQKLEQQPSQLQSSWQEELFTSLQYLLVNYPIAKMVAKLKPNTSIKNFIHLLKPIDDLLKQWQMESIGKPWEKVSFNPEIHYSEEEKLTPEEEVYIRLVGYKQGEKILTKAKVSRQLPGQH